MTRQPRYTLGPRVPVLVDLRMGFVHRTSEKTADPHYASNEHRRWREQVLHRAG